MFNVCKQFQSTNVTLPFYGNYFIAFSRYYAPVHEIFIIFIITLGLMSNASLLIVLTRKRMSSPTNTFLIGISIADSSVLITYFFIWLQIVLFGFGSFEYAYVFATMLPPYIIYRGVSSLITVLLALWRVTSLYFPFQSRIKLNGENAIKGSLICFGLCQVLFIPQTYSFGVSYANCTFSKGIKRVIYYVSQFLYACAQFNLLIMFRFFCLCFR